MFQGDNELEPVDNCITSVLGRHVELTEEFTRCYEEWLQREVLNTTIHWDLLLSTNTNTPTSSSQRRGQKKGGGVCDKCSTAAELAKLKKGAGASVDGDTTKGKEASEDGKVIDAGAGNVVECECNRRLVSEGGSYEYTPLIEQLSGQFSRHHHHTPLVASSGRGLSRRTDKGEQDINKEEEEEDEYDRKEKMQTMIKKVSSSGSTNGGPAVVDIPLDDVEPVETTAAVQEVGEGMAQGRDQAMEVDANEPEEEQL